MITKQIITMEPSVYRTAQGPVGDSGYKLIGKGVRQPFRTWCRYYSTIQLSNVKPKQFQVEERPHPSAIILRMKLTLLVFIYFLTMNLLAVKMN